jgi:REP element-mobilizing transposase RayT
MPRTLRVHEPNGIYIVTSRGVERRVIFVTDEDRRVFMRYLMEALKKHDASLLAHCLMGNHFHLLIAISTTPLSVIMHDLLTRYALYFNSRHARVGHLFQGRYHADLCRSEKSLVERAAYTHLNPVRAGLVGDPARWVWSGHDELATGEARYVDLSRLLALTGLEPAEFKRAYQERVAQLMAAEKGTPQRPEMKEMIRLSALRFNVEPSRLVSGSRERRLQPAKKAVAQWAAEAGYSDSEIGVALGCSKSAVCHIRRK